MQVGREKIKMQSVYPEPNLVVDMTQERTRRRIRQLEEELSTEMQTPENLDKRRKTPKQKGATSTTALRRSPCGKNKFECCQSNCNH